MKTIVTIFGLLLSVNAMAFSNIECSVFKGHLTVAGNEDVTVYEGPYFTKSVTWDSAHVSTIVEHANSEVVYKVVAGPEMTKMTLGYVRPSGIVVSYSQDVDSLEGTQEFEIFVGDVGYDPSSYKLVCSVKNL